MRFNALFHYWVYSDKQMDKNHCLFRAYIKNRVDSKQRSDLLECHKYYGEKQCRDGGWGCVCLGWDRGCSFKECGQRSSLRRGHWSTDLKEGGKHDFWGRQREQQVQRARGRNLPGCL